MKAEEEKKSNWQKTLPLLVNFLIAVLPWGFIKQILKEEGITLGGFLSVFLLGLLMYLADKVKKLIKKIYGRR